MFLLCTILYLIVGFLVATAFKIFSYKKEKQKCFITEVDDFETAFDQLLFFLSFFFWPFAIAFFLIYIFANFAYEMSTKITKKLFDD